MESSTSATPEVSSTTREESATPHPGISSPAPPPPAVDFKVWRPPRDSGGTSVNLPDSYFEPTMAELQYAYASQQKKRDALNNAPLKTQALRSVEEQAKREKWPTTRIRIKFSDRTQLEKSFPSTDKIRSVYAFVRNSLRDDVKPIKFVLYQSPPRRELKVSDPKVRDLSLFELQLAPASVLLLSFEDPGLNQSDLPAPLLPEILSAAQDFPTAPPPEAETRPAERPPQTLGGGAAKDDDKGKSDKEKKLARFLKLGKK